MNHTNWFCHKFYLPSVILGMANYYRKKTNTSPKNCEQVILVQSVEDAYYFCLFGAIISEISKYGNFRVQQFIPRLLHVNESKNLMRFIIYRISNLVFGIKWVNLYKSYAPFVGFKILKFNFIFDLIDAVLAFKSYKLINSDDELLALNIKNIYVGDLINDTYIRFKPFPRVVLRDFYLLSIIWHAYRLVRMSQKYFSLTRPIIFLTSYSTYLQHGIAVRVALMHDIQVYSFGNYQQFSKKLTTNDFYHTKNTKNYRLEFNLLENKVQCLKLAEEKFERKIAGEIDHHFSYMKNSAYDIKEYDVPIVRGANIIFLHDFFDSPHIYPDMVFQDFWHWICFTIDCLDSVNLKYFIKPHPNQIGLNDTVLDSLIKKYPHLQFISSKVTNTQLIEGGIASAITMYGSVAHEMAYFGIPSIACGCHPHIAYTFCQTAHSKEEYRKLILSLSAQIKLNPSKMRKESLEFYFMHNLNLNVSELDLMRISNSLRDSCSKMNLKEPPDLINIVKKLSLNVAFKKFCKKVINEVSLEKKII